jgi:hypothetical protein
MFINNKAAGVSSDFAGKPMISYPVKEGYGSGAGAILHRFGSLVKLVTSKLINRGGVGNESNHINNVGITMHLAFICRCSPCPVV